MNGVFKRMQQIYIKQEDWVLYGSYLKLARSWVNLEYSVVAENDAFVCSPPGFELNHGRAFIQLLPECVQHQHWILKVFWEDKLVRIYDIHLDDVKILSPTKKPGMFFMEEEGSVLEMLKNAK